MSTKTCEECGKELNENNTGFTMANLHVCKNCMESDQVERDESYEDIKKSLSENSE